MKLHELKIKEEFYRDIILGLKTFEIRKNDRDYQLKDLIRFRIVFVNGDISEKDDLFKITYILRDAEQYGLQEGYCILGIKKVKVEE